MSDHLTTLLRVLSRRKTSSNPGDGGEQRQRCLTVLDATCLGLAPVLGVGIYCLMGEAARTHSGPAVVLSYLVAAVASCLVGLCFSELATRFPLGGSAYVYTYATTGEFCAFVIGWGMILEYTFGAALAAKTWSQYVDVVTNGSLCRAMNNWIGVLSVPGFDTTPDIPAASMILIVTVGVVGKVKLGCIVNNALVFINLLVITGVILVGMFNMDAENWIARAGFFPFGLGGVITGATLCFYAFIGFDIIATSAGEMEHRSKVLADAVSLTFLIGLVASFITAASITLVVPSSLLEKRGSLLEVFDIRKIYGMKLFVLIGASSGLLSSVWACLFALSRVQHSLANDGLLFSFLSHYNNNTGTACWASLASFLLSALVAVFCDSSGLLNMLGMGTLVAYSSVAVSVLCLRYGVAERLPLELGELSRESTLTLPLGSSSNIYLSQVNSSTQTHNLNSTKEEGPQTPSTPIHETWETVTACTPSSDQIGEAAVMVGTVQRDYGAIQPRAMSVEFINENYVTSLSDLTSLGYQKQEPNQKSVATSAAMVATIFSLAAVMGLLTMHAPLLGHENRWWLEVITCMLFVAVILCVAVLLKQPRHRPHLKNGVACIPFLPICAIWISVHLMTCLSYTAWMTFLVWDLLGILIYMGYGVWHTNERHIDLREVALVDVIDEFEESEDEVLVEGP
ncbi:cationic amino acid transporter 2-like [Tachypleus tridentatus]|uniref:cationic amino acid transporter 2-like n=1 Tax=Tachypleus tridentatus TaxID=6853 RepID=UPI003FCF16A7